MGSRPFGYRDAIAVLQIVAFAIYLGVGWIILCTRRNGWFGLGLFALARIGAAGNLLATLRDDTRNAWAGVMILEMVAIGFLTVLLKALLARANRFVGAIGSWGFVLPELLSVPAICIACAGFVYALRGADFLAPNPITQSAVALFSAVYLYTIGLFFRLWAGRDRVPHEERSLLWCFAACVPFMAARIVYSFYYIVTGDLRFNAVLGDPTIYLFLVAANEVLIVAAWSSTVLRLGRMPSPEMVEKMRRRRREHNEGPGRTLEEGVRVGRAAKPPNI